MEIRARKWGKGDEREGRVVGAAAGADGEALRRMLRRSAASAPPPPLRRDLRAGQQVDSDGRTERGDRVAASCRQHVVECRRRNLRDFGWW